MAKINPNQLSGEDLFTYYTQDHDDANYRSIVQLLPLACGDFKKAIAILEQVVKNGKVLAICYPSKESIPKGAEIIGSVPDGVMYSI